MQFATNHLGHFALATGLHDALAAAGGARIVSVSSSAHLRSPVVFEDIHFQQRAYEPWAAYGQSKTANVLFAVEATKRWADDGITANALMPGGIRTNLQRHVTEEELDAMRAPPAAALRAGRRPSRAPRRRCWWRRRRCSTASAAATSRTATRPSSTSRAPVAGVAAYALDPVAAQRLWEVSVETLAT